MVQEAFIKAYQQLHRFQRGRDFGAWIKEIALQDITPNLARRSGFLGVVDLLKVAKHGTGERVYLVEFEHHATA